MVTQVSSAYTDIHSWENLYAAYRQAARGKRGRAAAAGFEYRLEDNLLQLEMELAELEAVWRQEEELAQIIDDELTDVPMLESFRRTVLRKG